MSHDNLGTVQARGNSPRILQQLATAFAALTTGSRIIPLGDNGALLRDLAARVDRSRGTARIGHLTDR